MAAPSRSLFVALLAGGRGARFWPLSRRMRPKQLLDVTGEGPMLRRTLERVAGLVRPENVLLVTSEDLAAPSRALLSLPARNVLTEPVGRNTAPAVALAVAAAAARDPGAVVACLPSDHHVVNVRRLASLLARAAREAGSRGVPVLLGVTPGGPSSEYGYVVPGTAAGSRSGLRRVARFVEKPNVPAARKLLAQGALWNSGMFVLPVQPTLEAITRFTPELAAGIAALPFRRGPAALRRALGATWPGLPALSFDAAILQRWKDVHVLAAGDLGWSDVGSYDALAALMPGDAAGNVRRGPAFLVDCNDCVAWQQDPGRSLVLFGARDLLVVDAGDVVFVAPRASARRLRELVETLDRERPELT